MGVTTYITGYIMYNHVYVYDIVYLTYYNELQRIDSGEMH